MKHLQLLLVSVLMVGCSSDETYRGLQSMEQSRCAEGPASEYQNCLKNSEMSYEEYEAERQEAARKGLPSAPAPVGAPTAKRADQRLLHGRFRIIDATPWFEDCSNGHTFPVAQTGAFEDLKNTYQNSGIKSGEPLVVAVLGRTLERQEEPDKNNKFILIVDKVETIIQLGDCVPDGAADLQDTYWKLVEIGGTPVVRNEDAGEAHLILNSTDARAHGSGGCNRFFAQYQNAGDALRFSAVGSTMMARPAGMETEQEFFNVLGQTQRARITGRILELYGPEGLLARLEAVNRN